MILSHPNSAPNGHDAVMVLRIERAITRLGLPLGFDGDPLAEQFPEAETYGDILAACDLLLSLPAKLRILDRRLAHRMCKAAVFGRSRSASLQIGRVAG